MKNAVLIIILYGISSGMLHGMHQENAGTSDNKEQEICYFCESPSQEPLSNSSSCAHKFHQNCFNEVFADSSGIVATSLAHVCLKCKVGGRVFVFEEDDGDKIWHRIPRSKYPNE